jgi:hypothetical protein
MRDHHLRALCAAITLLASGFFQEAGAQTDHLKCYKIKDVAQFKSATADLVPLDPQFAGQNCVISGKAGQLCVPAEKTNAVIVEGTLQDFGTQALQDAQLCYKLKCPKLDIAPLEVSDQFGTRNIQKFKVAKVCGPALQQ